MDIARFFLTFTKKESCGKCTFCRIGTRRRRAILTRITGGAGTAADLKLLEELAIKIKAASPVRPGPDGAQSGAAGPRLTYEFWARPEIH